LKKTTSNNVSGDIYGLLNYFSDNYKVVIVCFVSLIVIGSIYNSINKSNGSIFFNSSALKTSEIQGKVINTALAQNKQQSCVLNSMKDNYNYIQENLRSQGISINNQQKLLDLIKHEVHKNNTQCESVIQLLKSQNNHVKQASTVLRQSESLSSVVNSQVGIVEQLSAQFLVNSNKINDHNTIFKTIKTCILKQQQNVMYNKSSIDNNASNIHTVKQQIQIILEKLNNIN